MVSRAQVEPFSSEKMKHILNLVKIDLIKQD